MAQMDTSDSPQSGADQWFQSSGLLFSWKGRRLRVAQMKRGRPSGIVGELPEAHAQAFREWIQELDATR